jgi:hypothetical protein
MPRGRLSRRATFDASGKPTIGSAWEKTPWLAVQRAARRARSIVWSGRPNEFRMTVVVAASHWYLLAEEHYGR